MDFLDPGGPLTDTNVFVSELLLQLADGSRRSFFEQVLGGFTFSRQQPAYSVCGCEDPTSEACAASLANTDVLNGLVAKKNCEAVPTVPLFCDDNTELLESLLGIDSSLLVGEVTDLLIVAAMLPSLFLGDGSGNNMDCNTEALSVYPTCVASGSNQTAYCVDLSCNVSGSCNTSSQSPSAQYGNVPSSGNVALTIWYNNQVRRSKYWVCSSQSITTSIVFVHKIFMEVAFMLI